MSQPLAPARTRSVAAAFRPASVGLVAGLAAASIVLPSTAGAQSAGEILETAAERYQERMEGIENYTVVQEFSGMVTEQRYERVEVDGRTEFHLRTPGVQGAGPGAAPSDVYASMMELSSRAELEGRESVGGAETFVLSFGDLDGTDVGEAMAEGGFTPSVTRLWIDTDDYVVRKTYMEGEAEINGRSNPMTIESVMEDYRTVEGMLYPFRTRLTISGIGDAMTDEQRAQLEEAKRQMEQAPPAMRAQFEKMLEERMGDMMNMMEGRETVMTVQELRVNTGS